MRPLRNIAFLWPVLALLVSAGRGGPEGASMSVPEWSEYCMYTVYSVITSYTWYDPLAATSDTGSNSSSSSSSSSNSGSSSTGSDSSGGNTAHGGSSSGHGGHKLIRRGHRGSSTTTQCNTTNEVASIYAAAKEYCRPKELKTGISWWQSQCSSAGASLMDLTTIEAKLNSSYLASLSRIDPETNTTTAVGTLNQTVLLTKSYYKRAYKSYWGHDYALLYQDRVYGWALMGFWGGILVLGTVANLWKTLTVKPYSSVKDLEGTAPSRESPPSTLVHWLRTHLIIPATISSHPFHQKMFMWNTIPKRLDMLIVAGFWIVSILLGCVDYLSFNGNIQTTSVPQQVWQYVSDRTGILSYACFPMLWLFGLRNNIFIWATGWNFRTFNIFHRHIARVATIYAIVHSIGYTVVYGVYEDNYKSDVSSSWFYLGILATITMSLMLLFSHDYLRAKFYETFLIIHIALAVVTIYSLFCHTPYQPSLYNNAYLWPPVAFWLADRFLRTVRAFYCNLHVRLSGKLITTTTATVTYSAASDVIHMTVQPGSQLLKPGPGQYYHLYQPFALRGWENHPFTLASYSNETDAISQVVNHVTGDTKEAKVHSSALTTTGQTLTFLIRPYDGWTKRLRSQCQKSPIGMITPYILVEGPYGHFESLTGFDTILLMVGGTGVAAAIPRVIQHVKDCEDGKTRTTRVKMVWTAKQAAFIEEVCQRELAPFTSREDLELQLYASRESRTVSNGENHDKCDAESTMSLDIKAGRPDIDGLICSAAMDAKSEGSKVVVLTCGPAAMADDARAAVHRAMKDGCRTIEYVEESFGW